MVTRLQTNKRWSQQRHGQILKIQSSSSQITEDQQSPISTIATFTNLVRNPSEYSDCSADNGNTAHLRFSVTNHSINSYDTIQSTRSISLQNSNTGMFKRRPWLKLAIVIIVVLVLAGISAAVTVLVLRNKPGILSGDYLSTVELTARVDDEFQTNMTNTSSSEFLAYETKFCSSINQTLQDQAIMPNCAVNKLSNGSVVVYSTVTLITNASNLQDSLTSWLQRNSSDSHVSWGNMSVFTKEINISVTKTIKYPKPGPDNYDCSKVSEPTFLPFSNTYPDNCSAFQLCSNGKVLQLHCGPGLEFSIVSSSNDVVCDAYSERTYCGMRRSAITQSSNTSAATTTTFTLPVNTNFSSTASPSFSTGSTVTSTNELTSTAETTSVDFCQQWETIFSNLTSDCTRAGDYFIPQMDTYPENCRNFIWCTKVNNSFNISCANGTEFKVQEYRLGSPCVHESDNDTYCKVRSRYEKCPQRKYFL